MVLSNYQDSHGFSRQITPYEEEDWQRNKFEKENIKHGNVIAESGYSGSSEPLVDTLEKRHQTVTDLTKFYYKGDVIPPSTKSQILRALKFSVMYYYFMNATFFVYAFFIPATLPAPWYGGLDVREFYASPPHLVIMGVVLCIPLIRFLVMSWHVEFYQFVLILGGFEGSMLLFTALFWSHGLPVLVSLFVSNLINITVGQIYWKLHFEETVRALPTLVPPPASHVQDSTVLSVFSWKTLYEDFAKLWGFQRHRSPAMLYDERCGVFSTKDSMSHVQSMHCAYMQALDPFGRHAPWKRSPVDLWSLSWVGILDGLLNTFITNAAVCFAGLWLGKAMFEDFFHGGYAILCAVLIVCIFFVSLRRTTGLMEDALGVAVAEKEWLAHDVVRHGAQREEIVFDVLDVMGQADTTEDKLVSPEFENRGRLNIVFMWLCVASVSDFIGESHLAKMYWNLALETRYMMEALTPYDFKLFPHAKWEVTFKGVLIKTLQTLVVALISCLYFGTYFAQAPVPVPLMALLGATCFVQSILKMLEAVQFAFSILGVGHTHRHNKVSEFIVGIGLMFVLINVFLWLYLLPMMKDWDLPLGQCKAMFNRELFPSACQDKWEPPPPPPPLK
mmetsp:Transcript_48853/g.128875  ORF Transcript_48853/g.128875 Transcript_48853/m.128875 type:complete len:616 (+) Transcript_48853:95-1942(+)|eukprot:CAMPEP_0115209752 /NCGR_PEP_ID=MMETSP0270-20121206/21896_1 /TAXON_ID=71861 /ORGANISM="Scrippsiella trochoidea, Strain CCMP3099" /LENGTH=615 /DNA_ID=CAMNT_0002623391 /DNA_START=89 /DNA_END=1936 /DNA_ORIENTATION=+